MAKNGVTPIVKKNSKLEAFLKKNLDVDTFEKIRAYDSCLVCSEKEDKAFKYVILADEWIYLTENPPKKLYETIHLKDLVSIELVNEFPEFLQGDERENVQHLIIHYLTEESPKRSRSARKGKTKDDVSPREPSPGPTTPRSARSTGGKNSIITSYSMRSYSARDTRESKLLTARHLLAENKRSQTARDSSTHNDQIDHPRVPSLPKNVTFGRNTLQVPGQKSGTARPISPILKRKNVAQTDSGDGDSDSSIKQKAKKGKGKDSDLNSSGKRPLPKPLTPRMKGELKLDLTQLVDSEEEEEEITAGEDSLSLNNNDSKTKDQQVSVPVVKSKGLCGGKKSKPTENKLDDEEDFLITLRDGSVITLDYLMPQIVLDETSSTVFTAGDGAQGSVREATMHLYVMSGTSKIMMLTKSAWRNYLIRGTLEEDPSYVVKTTVLVPHSAQPSSEKLEYLFRQLKVEMQYTTNTMEDVFIHVHELKVAAERNFALRKLFWKTPDVFRFIVGQFRKYVQIPPSKARLYQSEEKLKTMRADQLEFLILLLETLALMLRETEIVQTRIQIMKAEGGHFAQHLIAVLINKPEVPDISTNLTTRLRILQNATSDMGLFGSEMDEELHHLLTEYQNMAATVLFELLMIGEQSAWCDSETSLLNVNWIVQQVCAQDSVESFIEHVIAEAMAVISPRHSQMVTPSEAVLLYHQFYILQTLVDFSKDITEFIRNNFFEEFKYYIQGPVLQEKLPSKYPLRPYIFSLMERVVGKVLLKKVSLTKISKS